MIRAAAALLLGSLAMAAGNENLRGNSKSQEEERDLQQMAMGTNLDLGEMDCVEQEDLSVVCTFRIMPPADFTTANILKDCPRGKNGSFCLTSEVYRSTFGDLPSIIQRPQPIQQQPPVQQQPPPPVQQQPVQLPFVGRCPSAPQATGMACARYIPSGSRNTSCYFGRTQCNCALNDSPSVVETWSCRLIPNDISVQPIQQSPVQQQPVQQQPETVVVTTPVKPVTVIDANINNVAIPASAPTLPPIPSSSGVILPNFVNNPSCPDTKPNAGDPCGWGQSCTYYTSTTTAEDCLCDGSYEFKCRASRHPGLFSSF